MTKSKIAIRERRFMWAVQALALSPRDQEELFPKFAEVTDELALEHQQTQEEFLECSSSARLSPTQREAIAALDGQLEKMSGPDNERFWTVHSLENAPEWGDVRELAREVLRAMHWRADAPPHDRGAIYVPSSRIGPTDVE